LLPAAGRPARGKSHSRLPSIQHSLYNAPLIPCIHPTLHALSFSQYTDERDLPLVMALVDAELSEPYSIFTYRCGSCVLVFAPF
jgi:hypothetical protein